jgi:hypothetical protein
MSPSSCAASNASTRMAAILCNRCSVSVVVPAAGTAECALCLPVHLGVLEWHKRLYILMASNGLVCLAMYLVH